MKTQLQLLRLMLLATATSASVSTYADLRLTVKIEDPSLDKTPAPIEIYLSSTSARIELASDKVILFFLTKKKVATLNPSLKEYFEQTRDAFLSAGPKLGGMAPEFNIAIGPSDGKSILVAGLPTTGHVWTASMSMKGPGGAGGPGGGGPGGPPGGGGRGPGMPGGAKPGKFTGQFQILSMNDVPELGPGASVPLLSTVLFGSPVLKKLVDQLDKERLFPLSGTFLVPNQGEVRFSVMKVERLDVGASQYQIPDQYKKVSVPKIEPLSPPGRNGG